MFVMLISAVCFVFYGGMCIFVDEERQIGSFSTKN